jgi:hypothetical protein
VATLENPRVARVRGIERDADGGLSVLSTYVAGDRLCDLLDAATGLPAHEATSPSVDAALGFLLEALAALDAFHSATGLAHGAVSPGRITLSANGDVVLLDTLFGQALERLQFNRRRLWSEFGLAMPAGAGPLRFDVAADISQASLAAMMIVLGRPLRANDYPDALPALINEVIEIAQIRGSNRFAADLHKFLHRALPLPARRAYASAEEAVMDVRQVAREIGVPRCRAALTAFVGDMNRVISEARANRPVERAGHAETAFVSPPPSAFDEPAIVYDDVVPAEEIEPIVPEPAPEVAYAHASVDHDIEPGVVEASEPERIDLPPEPIAEAHPIETEPATADVPDPVAAAPILEEAVAPEPIAAPPQPPTRSPEVAAKQPESEPAPADSRRARRNARRHRDKLRSHAAPPAPPPPPPRPPLIAPTPAFAAVAPLPSVPQPAPPPRKAPQPLRDETPLATPPAPVLPPITPVPVEPPAAAPQPPAPIAFRSDPSAFRNEPARFKPEPAFRTDAIAFKSDAAIGFKSEPLGLRGGPSGFAQPPRERAAWEPQEIGPYVDRREGKRGFPWRLAVAALVVIGVGIGAGRKFLPSNDAAQAAPMPSKEVVAAAKVAEAAEKLGSVVITTEPAGAHVLLDGKEMGDSPLTLENVPAGKHALMFVTASASVKRIVRVEAGKTLTLDVGVFSGWIAVYSPVPLDVSENGRAIGSSEQGRLMLSPGRHQLTLTNTEFGYSSVQTVDIEPGEERRISVEPTGELSANAVPWGEVWMDGKKIGETPAARLILPLGTHELVFKNPQFADRKVTVTVTSSTPATASVDFYK